jgi:nitroreductase/NAD-dependent dihydropyrimidine dehydrogenase PreA subunit
MIKIDNERCTRCGMCIDVCPARIFVWNTTQNEKPRIDVVNEEFCITCGHCVSICPENAVIHKRLPIDLFLPLEPVSITPDALINLMLSRRSIRAYKPEPVPQTLLKQLLEAASRAPTATNTQNVEFIVVQDVAMLAELETLVFEILWGSLKRLGNPIFRKLAQLKYEKDQYQAFYRHYQGFKHRKENDQIQGMIFRGALCAIVLHAPHAGTMETANCALAIANMTALAQTLELGTCWAGFLVEAARRSARFNQILDIPDSRKILGCLIVGYPKYRYKRSIPRKKPQINWF